MPRPNTILLPQLIPPQLIGLGYLVPKPLDPTTNPHTSIVEEEECLVPPHVDQQYTVDINVDKGGKFIVRAMDLFGVHLEGASSDVVHIKAARRTLKMLKNEDESFQKLCETDKAREWIAKMHQYRRKFYYIVAIDILEDASFYRKLSEDAAGGGKAYVPLQPGDLKFEGEMHIGGGGEIGFKSTGVIGIAVRKVSTRTFFGKDKDAELGGKLWKYTITNVKGVETDETRTMTAALGDYVDQGDLGDDSDEESSDEF